MEPTNPTAGSVPSTAGTSRSGQEPLENSNPRQPVVQDVSPFPQEDSIAMDPNANNGGQGPKDLENELPAQPLRATDQTESTCIANGSGSIDTSEPVQEGLGDADLELSALSQNARSIHGIERWQEASRSLPLFALAPMIPSTGSEGGLNVSSKVLASFLDWNSSNENPETQQEAGPEAEPEPEIDTTYLYYDSDDEEKNTGIWTPETEKYWALQYTCEEQEARRGCRMNFSSTNNNVIMEMQREVEGEKDKGLNRGGGGDQRLPAPRQPTIRHWDRALYWVCSTTGHPLDDVYNDPAYRSKFTAKVLLIKAIQGIVIWGTLTCYQLSPVIVEFHRRYFYMAYLALLCYIFLFIILRSTLMGETRRGAIICMSLTTACLIELLACLVFVSVFPLVICGSVMVLSLTFLLIAALCWFLKMDVVDSNNLYPVAIGIVFLITATSILTMSALSPTPTQFAEKVGSVFIPVLMSCESVTLLQLSELYQMLRGFRLPLLKSDWIRAAAHLV